MNYRNFEIRQIRNRTGQLKNRNRWDGPERFYVIHQTLAPGYRDFFELFQETDNRNIKLGNFNRLTDAIDNAYNFIGRQR